MSRPIVAVALLTPFLLAATDPQGDVGRCPPGSAGDGDPRIDVVEARGEIVERGTALRFTIAFGPAFEAPDSEGSPLRVDVLLRDPGVPTVDFRYYHDLNRIVRYDAVADPALQIVLLPERGANVFVGVVAIGDTVTMTLPGRLVTRDRDLEGLGLEQMRWSVIARDEGDCDALGDGQPTQRLVAEGSPSPIGSPSPPSEAPAPGEVPTTTPPAADPSGVAPWALVGAVIVAASAAAFLVARRNPRR